MIIINKYLITNRIEKWLIVSIVVVLEFYNVKIN